MIIGTTNQTNLSHWTKCVKTNTRPPGLKTKNKATRETINRTHIAVRKGMGIRILNGNSALILVGA